MIKYVFALVFSLLISVFVLSSLLEIYPFFVSVAASGNPVDFIENNDFLIDFIPSKLLLPWLLLAVPYFIFAIISYSVCTKILSYGALVYDEEKIKARGGESPSSLLENSLIWYIPLLNNLKGAAQLREFEAPQQGQPYANSLNIRGYQLSTWFLLVSLVVIPVLFLALLVTFDLTVYYLLVSYMVIFFTSLVVWGVSSFMLENKLKRQEVVIFQYFPHC